MHIILNRRLRINIINTIEKPKRLTFIINTPAQAFTWKYIIRDLSLKNYDIDIIARDYGSTVKVLDSTGFNYRLFKPKGSLIWRLFGVFDHFNQCYKLSKQYKSDMIIGFGIDCAVTAVRLNRKSINFIDNEFTIFQNKTTTFLSDAVITPACFLKDLGKKQVRYDGYKELAYLHPNHFNPDPLIYNELGITQGEKYIILRFNNFDAVHDIGKHGFSLDDQFTLVKELGKYMRVFISPEGKLSPELEKYRIPIENNRIHQALYFAQLLVSDTGTMTTEASILGTPSVICFSNFAEFGNFVELEQKYSLLFGFSKPKHAIDKALELIQQPSIKVEWSKKRQILLHDKTDFTKFMVDFIENYPTENKKFIVETLKHLLSLCKTKLVCLLYLRKIKSSKIN